MADSFDFRSDAMWDDLVSGTAPDLEGDAGAAGALRFTHSLSQTPIPGSARERARQRVFDSIAVSQENDMTALTLPASLPVTNGHSPGLRGAPSRTAAPRTLSRRQLWVSLAAVLAVLLAGMSGWFVYDRFGGNDSVPAVIPAVQDATPATGASDWPMYRGNPGRTGSMLGTGPKTAPGVVWSALLDGSAYRSPIVVGDTAYVGTAAGTFYALDAETGAVRWTFEGGNALEITPAYLDGVVYIPSVTGDLFAIDAATGTQLWRFAKPLAEFATPTFGDGLLFVGSETNNALYGIDPETGEEVWHFDTQSAISRGQAYADGVLYSGSEDGVVYALNGSDGTLVWQHDASLGGHGTPAVAGGILYTTTSDGELMLLDAATGDEIKRIASISDESITPPTIGDGLVYLGTHAGSIDAIDPETEQVIWSYPTHQTIQAALALVDGVIYGVGLDSTVFALDAATGAELWTYQTNGAMDFGPTIANGMVYVSTDAGQVLALGEGGGISATPAPVDVSSSVGESGFDQSQVQLLLTITGTEEHPLVAPQGIAIAPNGDIYVANAVTDTVEIFSPDGAWIDSLGGTGTGPGQFRFHNPGDQSGLGNVGFDVDGNLYVFDTMNNRIQKFAPNHTFLLEWGAAGSGNGEFDETTGDIDARTGRVYVTDLDNRVQVFDLDGNFLDKWGSTGSGPSKFRKPTDVAVDSNGNIYIAEEEGRRVQKFDQYGAFLESTGPNGTMEGDFGEIFAITVDANDYLYVADYIRNDIKILAPDGTLVGVIDAVDEAGSFINPSGVAFGPDGALYVADEGNNRILVLQLPSLES